MAAGSLSRTDLSVRNPEGSTIDWLIFDENSRTTVCGKVVGAIDSIEADVLSSHVFDLLSNGVDEQTSDSQYNISASDREHLDWSIADPDSGTTICGRVGEPIEAIEAEEFKNEVFRVLISGGPEVSD